MAALALSGGLLSTIAIEVLVAPFGDSGLLAWPGKRGLALAVTGVCTTLLFGLALHRALRRPRTACVVSLCAALGWLNTPLSLATFTALASWPVLGRPLVDSDWGRDPSGLAGALLAAVVFGGMLGIVTGLPIGTLYGWVAVAPSRRLAALFARPSHDLAARAAHAVAVPVLGASVFATAVALALVRYAHPMVSPLVPAALGAVALAVLLASRRHARQVAKLTAQLTEGQVPGFVRVPREELGDAADDLLPLSGEVSDAPSHVLCRVEGTHGAGAYRAGVARVPFALID